jgi:hypothetical protein
MTDCCKSGTEAKEHTNSCPRCGERGAAVELRAVKSLLKEGALVRVNCVSHRFCKTPSCQAVYYDEHGQVFVRDDVRVGVWHKEPYGERAICYCFGETESSIRTELLAGDSTAVARVRAHIEAGRCACDVRNPRGVCCLGDLTSAVQRVKAELAVPSEAR